MTTLSRRRIRIVVASLLLVLALAPWIARHAEAANPLDAVVGVRATVPGDARTAAVLGTRREGSGAVIDDNGLVLTIGYLILEAVHAEIVLPGERIIPADVVAYDYDTGFGLLRALAPLEIAPIALGSAADLAPETQALVAASGGPEPVVGAVVVSRRDFAGYWEYLLPDAIFTAPPHLAFGGAALIGRDGALLGIGSLIVGDAGGPGSQIAGNMFVPIDALQPILADLLTHGRSAAPARPWLGLYSEEVRDRLFVSRTAPGGPADAAGLQAGDVIVAVKDEPVSDMADFYRKVWALGEAGAEIPLTVLRPDGLSGITVRSGDRYDYLKLRQSY